ncbi:hypothetical protein DFAR_3800014 [Desulfarculales bacterium]
MPGLYGAPQYTQAQRPRLRAGSHVQPGGGIIFDQGSFTTGYWIRIKWSKATSIYGLGSGEVEMSPPVVSEEKLAANFGEGFSSYRETWTRIVSPEIVTKLAEIGDLPPDRLDYSTQLWVKTFYDFAICHQSGRLAHEELLSSLVLLYFGETLSYVRNTARMGVQQAEKFIENE